MRNLITFLIKNGTWFFFIFLEIICFYLIFQYNTYQHSLFLNSSNELVGRVYSISGNVHSYFGLRKDNEELITYNAELQSRVWELENELKELIADTTTSHAWLRDSAHMDVYDYVVARVVNNSINRADNYITINKGRNNGIKPDMGVLSQQGIVGIVREVSPNFARVQPVLNSMTRINCKVKGSNNTGTLVWDGKDYRYANLEGFPRHEVFSVGDTIITSGFSHIFPEGIFVGVVEDSKGQNDDHFLTLKLRLSTDFSSLSNVFVIENKVGSEQTELEQSLDKASHAK